MELSLEQQRQRAVAAAQAARARAEAWSGAGQMSDEDEAAAWDAARQRRAAGSQAGPRLTPVEGNPFTASPGMTLTPVDHDPFSSPEVEAIRARARAEKARAEAQGQAGGGPGDRHRIQGNIQKMIDQGAPEAEIDAYVAAEGFTPEQLRNASPARERQVQAEYDGMPWYQQAGRAALDIARLGLDGASFGFGDKLLAGIEAAGTDKTYDETLQLHRQATDDARTRSGSAGDVAELGAGILPMAKAAQVGATAFRALPQGAGALGRMTAAACPSSAMGPRRCPIGSRRARPSSLRR